MASVPLLRRAGNVVAFGYLTLGYVFIFLPVAVLILFSFQDGALPVPPSRGRPSSGTSGCSPTTG